MKIKPFILILITLFIVSCSKNNSKTFKTYYDNGGIKEEYTIDNNGKRNGIATSYFDNGNIQSIYHYKNDSINGYCKEFHKNGVLKYKYFSKGNQNIGSAYEYYENGSISKYKLFDSLGRLAYFREYDKSGEFRKEEGVGSITDIIKKVEYKDSVVFPIKLNIIEPPNTSKHIKFFQYEREDKILKYLEVKDTTQIFYNLNTQYGNKLKIIIEIDDGKAISEFVQVLDLS